MRLIPILFNSNVTMAEMNRDQVIAIVELWKSEYASFSQEGYIQIFENKGSAMGGTINSKLFTK